MSKVNTNGIKVVVFDMAGTTIDEGKTVYRAVLAAVSTYGFDYTLNEVINRIGGMNKKEGIRLLMTDAERTPSEALVDTAFELFRESVEEAYRNDESITEKEGATGLFKCLRDQGIKVVLDTGYFRSTANILIDKMGWEEQGLIDFSVTSDEVEKGRPEPLMIQRVMEHFGFMDPQVVLKVGDTRSDIEEGHNAGCNKVVGISSDQYDKTALLEMGASHAIDELEELKHIITT